MAIGWARHILPIPLPCRPFRSGPEWPEGLEGPDGQRREAAYPEREPSRGAYPGERCEHGFLPQYSE